MSSPNERRRSKHLGFTSGNVDIDATLTNDDYKDITFIFRNLNLIKDCEIDHSYNLETRRHMTKMISIQISFYVYCSLKSSLLIRELPKILIFGTGFVGSRVINDLINHGLTSCLYVYLRGDEEIEYWKTKGIHIHNNMNILLSKHKVDIIIMCTPLNSFPMISKQIKPFITSTTMFLYTTIGLQRRRIFNTLLIPTCLRTYQEPVQLNYQLRKNHLMKRGIYDDTDSNTFKNKFDIGFGSPITISKSVSTKDTSHQYDDEMDTLIEDPSHTEDPSRSILLDETLSDIEMAAEMIVNRLIDIRNLIYMIENYYALRGMGHAKARHEALLSILNYEDREFEKYHMNLDDDESYEMPRAMPSPVSLESYANSRDKFKSKSKIIFHTEEEVIEEERLENNANIISQILTNLTNSIVIPFQKQFSKHMRVLQIPRISRVINRLSEINKYIRHGNDYTIVTKDIKLAAEEFLLADSYNEYTDHSRKFYDGKKVAMHTNKLINKIYDQDRKYIHQNEDDRSDDDMFSSQDGSDNIHINAKTRYDHFTDSRYNNNAQNGNGNERNISRSKECSNIIISDKMDETDYIPELGSLDQSIGLSSQITDELDD